MKKKKYELIAETRRVFRGRTLYRIRAIKDFYDISKGELGGWIESEDNLSQENDCWVYYDAIVYDNATVYGKARVYGHAIISDYAKIHENAVVFDAVIRGYADVFGSAKLRGSAVACDNASISGNCCIHGSAYIGGKFTVDGPVEISQGNNTEDITIRSTKQWYKLRAAVSELEEEFTKNT